MTIGTAWMHDSAPLHVSGQAQYCDDILLPENTLHAAFGMSPIAHGRSMALDLAGVVAALSFMMSVSRRIGTFPSITRRVRWPWFVTTQSPSMTRSLGLSSIFRATAPSSTQSVHRYGCGLRLG